MKKLNKKGVSLAETLGAITILGIVLGVALMVVNSRAKQLDIINTEMTTMFELSDDSNRFYLSGQPKSDTPSSINNKESLHIIQKGSELKVNNNIAKEVRDELVNNPDIIDSEEYLLSYIKKGDRYYHMLRLNNKSLGDFDECLFPYTTPLEDGQSYVPIKDDILPPVKFNPPIEVNESENNMTYNHTNKIQTEINNKLSTIISLPEVDHEMLNESNKYNSGIFKRKAIPNSGVAYHNLIPTSVTLAKDEPLALQVKMYNRNYYDNVQSSDPNIRGIEYKEIHFFALLDAEFTVEKNTYHDYIKVYGSFTADYKNESNKLIITSHITDLPNQKYGDRFYNQQSDWTNVTIADSPLLTSKEYTMDYTKANLIRDAIGYTIVDYIENMLNNGNDLYSGGN